jgi:hypothetical protein
MSSISSGGDSNPNDPNDPLHYAPRSVRSKVSPPTKPARLASSPSGFDEMLKEAVAKSRAHPLDPVVVYAPHRPRARFGIAARFATAFGVVVIIGLLFFSIIPRSQGSDPSSAGTANQSQDSQALLQKFVQFEKSQDSRPAGAAQTAPDQSQALLQKFMQWQQKQQ